VPSEGRPKKRRNRLCWENEVPWITNLDKSSAKGRIKTIYKGHTRKKFKGRKEKKEGEAETAGRKYDRLGSK